MTPLWTLEVPEASPSLNAFANKRGRFVYQRLRMHWEHQLVGAWYMARAASPALAGLTPPRRARLTVVRASPKALDPDNLVGGLKPILDALRRLALIHDDDPDSLALEVHAQYAPKRSTRLVLEVWP